MTIINDSDIKIDADCNIIESHVTDGEVMWEKLFQAILECHGYHFTHCRSGQLCFR